MIVYHEVATVARELGIPLKTLYGVSNNISAHYHKVALPKKNGGTRILSVPDPVLKTIQCAIADTLLHLSPVSRYAKAYKPAASVKANALPHVGKKKLLKLDILHFFDSILYSTVKEKVFPASRYAEPIRILLTMLCYERDALPQGAPSSPAITNIILFDFDETVGAFCHERGIAYTRYCDDMTFSGDFDEKEVTAFIEAELRIRGFFLNRSKTAVIRHTQRQTVTGIVVNEAPALPRATRRELRQAVYYCKTYGVANHLARIQSSTSPGKYLEKLLGKISYALSVDPDDADLQKARKTVLLLIGLEKRTPDPTQP